MTKICPALNADGYIFPKYLSTENIRGGISAITAQSGVIFMKKEFNLRSLAKALAHDISPVRVHNGLKEMIDFYDRLHHIESDRVASVFNCVGAMGLHMTGAGLGASGCGFIAFLATRGIGLPDRVAVATEVSAILAGAVLLNPMAAKIIMNVFETSGTAMCRLANKLARAIGKKECEIRPYPKFDAYPEFRKALAEMKPQ